MGIISIINQKIETCFYKVEASLPADSSCTSPLIPFFHRLGPLHLQNYLHYPNSYKACLVTTQYKVGSRLAIEATYLNKLQGPRAVQGFARDSSCLDTSLATLLLGILKQK